ncbi:hypothetical protein Lqui_1480 [Legionella quinlivanii]|uniref:Secondary thiamine-phosphate synthase enzyme n=1 Tax=Legionella quinlivanii TaxID=45073 RepID=A0A0W0XZI6_9GAMM|nr:secondary thiamine-phosphate synthase enzyme YjbQ [Legionella quinlivanii]KTD50155.1 hypothetical protein Lqui_1480 [Legionella quinlivanii]MCW8450100.1 secondary thiamine-phosphate synthase enzyme YjbQ [Legionella quinlivanii]SEF49277.1 secondary thiamine-phosphate synthase enzyme [Legionella quinlivanii DSM 21216]STY11753.1 Uncharacterized conserved protein [Legionella quinlivanii]
MAESIYWQTDIQLPVKSRGFHLITSEVIKSMQGATRIKIGLANLFLQHTSASLAISENTCQDVPFDLETHFNRLIPDDDQLFRHTLEGSDDMPAHIKNVMLGSSLTIPIKDGRLLLGRWQGIYLCEHRNQASARRLIVTIQGS